MRPRLTAAILAAGLTIGGVTVDPRIQYTAVSEGGSVGPSAHAKVVLDAVDRCGVWPLALPIYHPFTGSCVIHDLDYVHLREPREDRDNEFTARNEEIARLHAGCEDPPPTACHQLMTEAEFYHSVVRKLGWIPWQLRRLSQGWTKARLES